MKNIVQYLIAIIFLIIISCNNSTNKNDQSSEKCFGATYEVNLKTRDTINRTDCKGKKQGKWVRSPRVAVRDSMWNAGDTIYFKNDTVILQR